MSIAELRASFVVKVLRQSRVSLPNNCPTSKAVASFATTMMDAIVWAKQFADDAPVELLNGARFEHTKA